jgi:hypothetical protein
MDYVIYLLVMNFIHSHLIIIIIINQISLIYYVY